MKMLLVVKPKASALVMSMRSIGYSLNNAVADIIDNSISAKATKIEIICNWDGNEPFIEIKDDGIGMDEKTAKNTVRISIGKFITEKDIITLTDAIKEIIV